MKKRVTSLAEGKLITIFLVRTVLLSLFSFTFTPLFSQQMTGLGFDNYNGAAGSQINPAFLTNSKVYMDINLGTADFFIENDMGYFNKDSTSFMSLVHMAWKHSFQHANIHVIAYQNHNSKSFFVSSRIQGPSFMIQKGRQAVALGFSVRSVSSGINIPYEFILSHGKLSDPVVLHKSFHDKNFSIASLNWAEISLNYAYDLIDRGNTKVTVGAGIKYLFGIGGAYAAVSNVNYSVPNTITLNINNFSSSIAYAIPIDYDNPDKVDFHPVFKGHGVGLDVGVLFTKLKTFTDPGEKRWCAKPYADYIYKLGISIMDIGGIRFRHHTEVHRFNNDSANWQQFDTVATPSIHSTMEMISSVFLGNPHASLTDTAMYMSLPTTLSVQYDYHFNGPFYLGAYWLQPLHFRLKSVRQSPVLAVIPRYETRILGVSLPITIYNYEKIRIGAALRFYSITVGTEKLGTFLGIGDMTGMDFYFSVRFNLNKGSCMGYHKGACYNALF